jgi:hypothetical protein
MIKRGIFLILYYFSGDADAVGAIREACDYAIHLHFFAGTARLAAHSSWFFVCKQSVWRTNPPHPGEQRKQRNRIELSFPNQGAQHKITRFSFILPQKGTP